jgi:hypothetical protein
MLPYYVVERKAVFYLTDIQHSNSGHYTCEYSNKASPNVTSQPSDDLLLLVTGEERLSHFRMTYGDPQTGVREGPEEQKEEKIGSHLQSS